MTEKMRLQEMAVELTDFFVSGRDMDPETEALIRKYHALYERLYFPEMQDETD